MWCHHRSFVWNQGYNIIHGWEKYPITLHLAPEHVFTFNHTSNKSWVKLFSYMFQGHNLSMELIYVWEALKHVLNYFLWALIMCFALHTCSGAKCIHIQGSNAHGCMLNNVALHYQYCRNRDTFDTCCKNKGKQEQKRNTFDLFCFSSQIR